MARLNMALLGPPQIELDGEVPQTGSRKVVALLVYLALEGGAQRRSSLTALLWPETEPHRAHSNFRRTLFELRSALGDEWLRADRSEVELLRPDDLWLDVHEFQSRLDGSRQHDHRQELLCPDCFADLRSVVELYRGDFLQGFTLRDSPEFDQWQSQETERLRRDLMGALDSLINGYARSAEFDRAIAQAERLLTLDPLHEPGHRQLMRLHYWNGDRPAALQQYERCAEVLQRELDVPPMEQTERLLERIQVGELEPPAVEAEAPVPVPTPPEAARNPYKGLFAFTEEDAAYFFGRELFTIRLLEAVRRQPLVAVIGPSGSGKSSVVRAGLVARLSQDPDWRAVVSRPGSRPFRSLAAAMESLLDGEEVRSADEGEGRQLGEAQQVADALYSGEETLSGLLAAREHAPDSHILLVVDQFEELYALCPDPERRRRYVDALLEPSQRPQTGPQLVIALTLRADFLGQALNHRPFADALQGADTKLGPMTDMELERAIRLPARQVGVEFEPGLVDRILADLAQAPGRLPLLQFALTAMWELREGPMLTHAGYRDIGGVSGALAHHAEHVYAGLDPADRERVRKVLIQLVQPGQGHEDTRRLARRGELGAEGWGAVQKLADARLAVTGRSPGGAETVEVVHEALIQGWYRMRAWIEADRAFRLWQDRLRAAKGQWEESQRDEGALLRGALLTEAEGWLERRGSELSAPETEYIQAGLALRDREHRARESRRRRVLFTLGAGLLLTLALAGLAALQWRQAAYERDAGRRARSRQLSVQALSAVNEEIDLALLLAVEAVQAAETEEALEALGTALERSAHMTFLRGHSGTVFDVNLNPDGNRLVSIAPQGVIVWDLNSGRPLYRLGEEGPPITGAEVSPDGHTLAIGHEDGTVVLHELEGGASMAPPIAAHLRPVLDFMFSADGGQVTSISCPPAGICTELEFRSWEVGSVPPLTPPFRVESELPIDSGGGNLTGQKVVLGTRVRGDILLTDLEHRRTVTLQRAAHPGGVTAADLSPDERIVASGGTDGQLRLWDVESGELTSSPLQGHSGRITALSFDPLGEQLFSADALGTHLLWRHLDKDPQVTTLLGYSELVTAARFTFNGRRLVTGHADGSIVIWDLEAIGAASLPVQRIRGEVTSLTFNPQGDRLALATLDEELELRATDGLELVARWEVDIFPPVAMAFSPDGNALAGADDNGNIVLWEVPSGKVIQAIEGAHSGPVVSLAFLHDSGLVSIADSQVSRAWDLQSGTPLGEPANGPEGAFFGRTFLSPDGRLAARGTVAGPVYLWDPLTGEPLGEPLSGPTLPIAGVAFHPSMPVLAGGGCTDGDVNTGRCQAGEIWLWDWRSGQALGEPLRGNPGGVNALAFGPQGRLLAAVDAAADGSGNAFVWDMETRELLAEPVDLGGGLGEVIFSADGEHIAMLNESLDAFLWRYTDLRPSPAARVSESLEGLISDACRRAGRNLSLEEWDQYFPGVAYALTCPTLPGAKAPAGPGS